MQTSGKYMLMGALLLLSVHLVLSGPLGIRQKKQLYDSSLRSLYSVCDMNSDGDYSMVEQDCIFKLISFLSSRR